jgi:hypothetical protein
MTGGRAIGSCHVIHDEMRYAIDEIIATVEPAKDEVP